MNVTKSAAEVVESVINIGTGKTKISFINCVLLGILAGAYIGFGSVLAVRASGALSPEIWGSLIKVIFAVVFPTGLLLVLVAGADLFTGDCMYMPASLMNKKIGLGGFLKVLIVAYLANLLGGLLISWITVKTGVLMEASGDKRPWAAFAVNLANGKCGLSFGAAFWRGVMCNWLVCLAIFLSLSATDGVSKAILIWPPISAFVALGMEHSVANMTFIPMGILTGATQAYIDSGGPALTATWNKFFITNLIPVTLGNFVGGCVFVTMFYYKIANVKAAK
jgi:formate/nitrite transporter